MRGRWRGQGAVPEGPRGLRHNSRPRGTRVLGPLVHMARSVDCDCLAVHVVSHMDCCVGRHRLFGMPYKHPMNVVFAWHASQTMADRVAIRVDCGSIAFHMAYHVDGWPWDSCAMWKPVWIVALQ
ncbi:hypothetical protein GOP47_0030831 [Adiantum capillus-veneris]|nr:hypothetical protein GOP47_0030831 [Adiantum capillus-veneris]